MKKYFVVTGMLAAVLSGAPALAEPASVAEVAKEVATKIGKVSGFSANVETGESIEGEGAGSAVSSLMVSRLYGWKMTSSGANPFTIVTDFQTFYQYFPQEKRVMKTTADSPELKEMLTKPVTDMNPLALLDQQSLLFKGQETLAGETVYHIEGTTMSQLMPGGPAVRRTLSAWLSTEDGLPRKTVESVGISTGTTVYRDVKVNPPLKPADFAFTVPAGVTVVDTNQQMRKVEQMQAPAAAKSPAP